MLLSNIIIVDIVINFTITMRSDSYYEICIWVTYTVVAQARAIEDAAANPSEVCAWQQSGTHMDLTLTLSAPLYPAWLAPAKPSKTLQELVPRREAPKAPYRTAKQRLHDELSALAHQLQLVGEKAAASDMAGSCLEAAKPQLFALVRDMAAEMRRDGQQVGYLSRALLACGIAR